MLNKLTLETPLTKDSKPVKVGDSVTGLLLGDNNVSVEDNPTKSKHVATKEYVDSFAYQVINCGYYATATGNYLPINGYIVEKTSTTSSNEFVSFVAPYNGSVHKVMWRSEIAQNGDVIFGIHESADATEAPSLIASTTLTESINIADDITYTFNINNLSSNTLTMGNIYAFKLTHPSNPLDTNVTIVLKWDLT